MTDSKDPKNCLANLLATDASHMPDVVTAAVVLITTHGCDFSVVGRPSPLDPVFLKMREDILAIATKDPEAKVLLDVAKYDGADHGRDSHAATFGGKPATPPAPPPPAKTEAEKIAELEAAAKNELVGFIRDHIAPGGMLGGKIVDLLSNLPEAERNAHVEVMATIMVAHFLAKQSGLRNDGFLKLVKTFVEGPGA